MRGMAGPWYGQRLSHKTRTRITNNKKPRVQS